MKLSSRTKTLSFVRRSPRRRRKSLTMRMAKKKKTKANDLPAFKTSLFILNNLLGLNLLQTNGTDFPKSVQHK